MKIRPRIQTYLFYGLTTLMIVLSVFSLISAISWINRPFAGFLLYDFPYVGSMGNREWLGYKAGFRLLDRIVAVDGQPIWNGREFVEIIKDKTPGTQVNYLAEIKGQRRKVTIPVVNFSLIDFFLVFAIPFLGGLILYVLGVIVFILKPKTRTSWVFFLLCFCLGSYMVTGFETLTAYYLVHFHYLVLPLYAPLFVHLGLLFPDRKQFLDRWPGIEYLIYLPSLIIGIGYQIYLFNFEKILSTHSLAWLPSYKSIGVTNRLYLIFCVASLIGIIVHSTWKASNSLARRRAGIILFGVSIAFLPSALIMLIMWALKINFPWNFLVFFVIFFPASIAYSIVKHNLFDADTIIKRTVGYVVTTGMVIGAYGVVSVTLNVLVGQYAIAQSKAFPILFTLGVILVFNPLRDHIQALVDRIFFRKEYDYGDIVEKVGGAMTSLLELPLILKHLTQTFIEDMFIDTSSVMLLTSSGTEYQVFMADGEKKEAVEKRAFKRDDPLMEIIETEKRELTKHDVLEDPNYKEVSKSCVANFDELHASLIVPLVYQDQVIGSLNLGEKKSGKFYNREDIELLRTLAHQGAVAIENARLFQENLEKQRMEEELNIARNLQMSMLPSDCPEIKGFQIAAISYPAQEVGGDFYDFIDMGEDKTGMVIGDVTGKSVSGALVMSASRSVFRMLADAGLSVSESMERANRRLKQDTISGMFVALLFAVLNSQNRRLTLCSAGQTQPIHLSAKTGEAKLVETEGDTFPLGILDEVNYQDTEIQLSPGDRVLVYTDGIVEAMNQNEEIFGFERLLEVAREAGFKSAEAIMKETLDRVNEFAGGAAQHDDITLIVISVEE